MALDTEDRLAVMGLVAPHGHLVDDASPTARSSPGGPRAALPDHPFRSGPRLSSSRTRRAPSRVMISGSRRALESRDMP